MKNPIDLWMGNPIKGYSYYSFIEYFNAYYVNISNILDIKVDPMYLSIFQPEFYLKSIYDRLDIKFKEVDFLILNNQPMGSQFKQYNKNKFDKVCIELHNKSYKIVTCTPVDNNIPCTFNAGLTIQDIGAISTRAKYIVAILSGPMTSCFNLLTINNVNTIFLLCDIIFTFNHEKIKVCDTFEKLIQLIDPSINYPQRKIHNKIKHFKMNKYV
jgi:hypothetical protein